MVFIHGRAVRFCYPLQIKVYVMKLKDFIKQLQAFPDSEAEVVFHDQQGKILQKDDLIISANGTVYIEMKDNN